MFISHQKAGNPFQNFDQRVVNRTGDSLAVGEVVAFMLNLDVDGSSTPEALGGGPGQPTGDGTFGTSTTAPYTVVNGMFSNVDDTAAEAENLLACYAVVTDLLDGSGDDNTEIVVRLQGVVDVNAESANYDIGDELQVSGGNNSVEALAAATGNRPIGICLTEEDSATSVKALFFGWAALFGGQHE